MSVCVRSARRTGADFAAFPPIAGAVPSVKESPPMGGIQSRNSLPDERQFARVFGRVHFAAHQPESKVKQVRVHDIALAVVAYLGEPPRRDRRCHRTTADTDKRIDLYCEITRFINKEATWFWNFQNTYYAISTAKVKGLPKMYSGVIDVSRTWKE